VDVTVVIQAERKGAMQLLQEYTRIKSGDAGSDLGWNFLLDSLIFQTEARVRWLDACEERLARTPRAQLNALTPQETNLADGSEVLR
jgi:hypothetical protein